MLKLTETEKAQIVVLYLEGENTVALGKQFGVYPQTIWGFLKRRQIPLRSQSESQRKLAVRQDAFATITSESAYWVGFLMADGTVSKKQISCTVSECDLSHLEKLKSFLGYEGKIIRIAGREFGEYHRKATTRLTVNSQRLIKEIERFGLVPRKTHTARVQLLEFNPGFLAGVLSMEMDG